MIGDAERKRALLAPPRMELIEQSRAWYAAPEIFRSVRNRGG